MKMLNGTLRETIYEQSSHEGEAPAPLKETTYERDQVTYISDKIGLHKVENASSTKNAVSLHLYTPPHAHNYGFNLFDDKTGKKSHITNAPLFSEHGRVCKGERIAKM